MAVQQRHRLQFLGTLQPPKNSAKRRPQVGWINLVQDGSHLRVAGNVGHAIDRMQIFRLPAPPFIEGQQRLILQMKHRKGRHQGVIEGNLGVFGTMIGELAKISLESLDQCVHVEGFAHRSSVCRGNQLQRLGRDNFL